jgi:hypothetical protein
VTQPPAQASFMLPYNSNQLIGNNSTHSKRDFKANLDDALIRGINKIVEENPSIKSQPVTPELIKSVFNTGRCFVWPFCKPDNNM